MEEQTLLVHALQNPATQEAGFKILIKEYQQPLYWHIRKIVFDHEDADDVLQNTYIKVFKNIKNFRGESKLFSWMYRIATNEALTFIKQKSRKLGLSLNEFNEKQVNQLEADVYFEGDAIALKLQLAVANLPEKQRLVFNLKYYEELKYDEISEILETSVGALKASYHHAVKKIKNELDR
ncbi:MAG: RNA polymerase subunit sigma-70 [Candidatus Arcticimaribacter sp.]|nr:RNA polymerase sigma factor [Flavobacteriaceae bacterium]PSR10372.1 MAG: RNA polymerase subunit sigma-70 [Candidatus Arcticimaribacter sp.]PTM01851.1 MAG: RNA polymerase subunit sigma-70 [Candidatus Arcticimaribacter sp.]